MIGRARGRAKASVAGGGKPRYEVPSMESLHFVPRTGLRVASTFCGCGGSSLGYRMAGFEVAWANEFVEEARKSYEANASPRTAVDGSDVREVTPAKVFLATGLKEGELDVFDGSPPCASFSSAGNREKDWGKVKAYSDVRQRTDDLFFEYVRLVKGIRPKTFVAENVSGLAVGAAKGYFLDIIDALRACGYRVGARLLDAQWLGVPQQRRRVIFVGVREDLGFDPPCPEVLPYRYSISEALEGLPPPTDGELAEVGISGMAIGREWGHLRPGQTSTRYFNLVRTDASSPCPTVTAEVGNVGAAAVTHHSEPRKFTVAELKRICSFPDDFVLTGSFRQRCERLGRAVPPLMMKAVAASLRDALLRHSA